MPNYMANNDFIHMHQLRRKRLLWGLAFNLRILVGTVLWLLRGGGQVRVVKSAPIKSRSVAIVAIYTERPDILELLADLKDAGFDLVVVFNRQDIAPSEQLIAAADILLTRKNRGRDFGAYAKGAEYLSAQPDVYDRVLFVNDSSTYVKRSAALFRRVAESTNDYLGLTETWVGGDYLVHGTFFQISRRVFKPRKVQRFFRRYRHINSPRYAVECGEKRLCRILVGEMKINPLIIFPINEFLNHGTIDETSVSEYSGWFGLRDTGGMSAQIDGRNMPEMARLLSVRSSIQKSAQIERIQALSKLDPVQHLALLLVDATAYPFLKRNNLARNYCSLLQLRDFAERFDEPVRSRIVRDQMGVYARHFSAVGVQRMFRFAELWSAI